ncbi:DUF5825 family protein [Streptomyces longispororuber]|uniref:DUF5825 family protein n=1 Tax=Streptomyces longispororuber TaxID=68230 RepID=UPI00210E986C|nr:DUF5825 family protein [Streptomyces longispororuber]MCQ4211641.1 DUF5825 family protein [Streptomyces longispororuber]
MTALPTTVPHRVTGTDVHVTDPLPLHGDGRAVTQAVQFLRECLSLGLRVTYDVARPASDLLRPASDGSSDADGSSDTYDATSGTYDPAALRALRHLPPPAQHPDEPAGLTSWRDGHAYGMLYHRRGPDFVTVMDRRERPASARFTLDHPDLLAAFDALHEATPLDALDAVHQEAAGLLAEERLALVVDGWAVALPPRLRRWPVPCTGI